MIPPPPPPPANFIMKNTTSTITSTSTSTSISTHRPINSPIHLLTSYSMDVSSSHVVGMALTAATASSKLSNLSPVLVPRPIHTVAACADGVVAVLNVYEPSGRPARRAAEGLSKRRREVVAVLIAIVGVMVNLQVVERVSQLPVRFFNILLHILYNNFSTFVSRAYANDSVLH